jgi:antitoxin (DNA-binding transcriptional repressor) of toxin-antitoxin stability system
MRQTNEFDQLLDEGLSEYRDAEPLLGLADRVMQRLKTRQRKIHTALTWSFAAAVAISVVTVATFLLPRKAARKEVKQQAHVQQPTLPSIAKNVPGSQPAAQPAKLSQRHLRAGHEGLTTNGIAAARIVPARREQFPIPAPLSADERALLQLARTDPEILQVPATSDAEIAIAPIEISPLADEKAGAKGEN